MTFYVFIAHCSGCSKDFVSLDVQPSFCIFCGKSSLTVSKKDAKYSLYNEDIQMLV